MDLWGDTQYEEDFVGREKFLNDLEQAWSTHRLFGVFGLRSVGKSRTTLEFVHRKANELRTTIGTVVEVEIDLKLIASAGALHSQLCSRLGLEPDRPGAENWTEQLIEAFAERGQDAFLVLFDNAEDAIEGPYRDDLLGLCVKLVQRCRNVRTFLTSTTRAQFAQIRRAYYSTELTPLTYTEASTLLRNVAPGTDFGQYLPKIVELCEGLPLLILMVGSELTEDEGMIEPVDMVAFLAESRLRALSREFYPEEDRIADVYKKFIERLSKVFRSRLSVLGYIPGSFNAWQAKEILGLKDVAVAKDQALIPIRRRGMLSYDPSAKRFNIQGILRDCLDVYFTVRNIPEVRARYCRTFARVMEEVARGLGSVEYSRALAQFSVEQPNLQKLLTEVLLTREDTYHCFIQVAASCTALLEKFMTDECGKFYDGCLTVASQYGSDTDLATVHIAIGSLHTNAKGEFQFGERSYQKALALLKKGGHSMQMARIYQRIGWNLYQRGHNEEALFYLSKSLDTAAALGQDDTEPCIETLSSLGVVNTVLGRLEEATRYHFATLQKREKLQGKDHPAVGAILNNIGILYEQSNDSQKAMEFYERGLEIKKKNKATEWSIAYSLNNTANQYCSLRQFSRAESLLEEAMSVLYSAPKPHKGAVSLTHDTLGKVYMAKEDYSRAETCFQEAVDIRTSIMPGGLVCVESLSHLATSQARIGKAELALENTKTVLKYQTETTKAMPQNSIILESLECRANLYKSLGKSEEKQCRLLNRIEKELLRLKDIFVCKCNERRVMELEEKLMQVRERATYSQLA